MNVTNKSFKDYQPSVQFNSELRNATVYFFILIILNESMNDIFFFLGGGGLNKFHLRVNFFSLLFTFSFKKKLD